MHIHAGLVSDPLARCAGWQAVSQTAGLDTIPGMGVERSFDGTLEGTYFSMQRSRDMSTRLGYSNPDVVHEPLGPYSHVVSVPARAETFYISGQIGVAPDGSCGATIAEQADQAFANVIAVLKAHDLDAASVIKLIVFIVTGHDGEAVRAARLKHFGAVAPASSTVYIAQLVRPEWFVEVEAVAARI